MIKSYNQVKVVNPYSYTYTSKTGVTYFVSHHSNGDITKKEIRR